MITCILRHLVQTVLSWQLVDFSSPVHRFCEEKHCCHQRFRRGIPPGPSVLRAVHLPSCPRNAIWPFHGLTASNHRQNTMSFCAPTLAACPFESSRATTLQYGIINNQHIKKIMYPPSHLNIYANCEGQGHGEESN